MSTKRNRQAALLSANNTEVADPKNKDSAIQRRMELIDGGGRQNQHQPAVCNSLKIKLDHLKTFQPLTENQAKFFELYKSGSYFMGLFGSAGVGKTFLALYKAIEEVLDKTNSFKQVVVVRSAVQVRDQGFVPGDLETKSAIFELPYKEASETLFGRPDAWDRLKEQGYARFISTSAIRGISIDDAIIILDEAANCSWQELSAVITRVGHRSKLIVCGDRFQNDLQKTKYDQSGLDQFLSVCSIMNEFTPIYFTTNDIVRSSLVKNFVIACEQKGYNLT
jgi:phosphate starvation-inducible protein PhoH